MVPKRPRIRRDEAIVETCAGPDWRLCQWRCAVHRVGEPDAVPVHGCGLCKRVDNADRKLFTTPDPQLRSRHFAVVARFPDQQDRQIGGRCRLAARRSAKTGGERAGYEAAA